MGNEMGKSRSSLRWAGTMLLGACAVGASAGAQTCTTQAKMAPEVYAAISSAALSLANSIKANDASRVQASTIAEFATNFDATASIIRNTAPRVAADSFRVTQVYELEEPAAAAGAAATNVEFSCPLMNSTSETDFNFGTLPAGTYGFAMVEAEGPSPWLLTFVLQRQDATWKMAGIYTHSRTAAGHDGLWYWTEARKRLAASPAQPWLAWLLFAEAENLLKPANFVSTTNLDKLGTEETAARPPALADGISAETPLVIAANGQEFRFTQIVPEASDDGQRLNLMLHYKADSITDPTAARARNTAAAKALLDAHKELRQVFNSVWVFAESPNQPPFISDQPVSSIP